MVELRSPRIAGAGTTRQEHRAHQNVPRCPRPLILAEVTEQRVWNRLTSRHYEASRGVKRYQRRAILAAALERVGVGLRPTELTYEWKEWPTYAGPPYTTPWNG
jgi:hypothetical protein